MDDRRQLGVIAAGVVAVLVAVVAGPFLGASSDRAAAEVPTGVADDGAVITVMARNLYLGADVAVALDLLPDMPAAAQFMWEQVARTDFDARIDLLAAEAARDRPAIIGLQEATRWRCRPGNVGRSVDVFDFTTGFLEATRRAGVPYVIATADGQVAEQPGYRIPALPFLSRVDDPDTFQPLFGRDTATCGFDLADALLIREDLADRVVAAGTRSFADIYAVVPTILEIDRGYAWADVAFERATVRFVTTHLESLWDPDEVPHSARQARQLLEDLVETTTPVVVLGDLNADPRDPRGPEVPNPAGQPESGASCLPQVDRPNVASARGECNAYWTLLKGGFIDAGPDALDPANLTWGTSAELAGPDLDRLDAAIEMGNPYGFTDRLDFVLVRGGIHPIDARIIGNRWPHGAGMWACDAPTQVANTEAASARLAEEQLAGRLTGIGRCLPTDHAGVVAELALPGTGSAVSPPPVSRWSSPIGVWGVVGLLLLALIIWRVVRRVRRRLGRRRTAAAVGTDAEPR